MLSEHPAFPILLSTDMEASKAFYRDTLGMELVREDVYDGVLDRMVFRTGDAAQFVISHSTVGTSDTQTQMAWRVPDVRAAIVELRERGVVFEEYDYPDLHTTDCVGDMRHSWAAWFVDPCGNTLAVVEPKS
jgi:catechol 2,3-dioxygenase-like lactoylglutathione lyase family enzyme